MYVKWVFRWLFWTYNGHFDDFWLFRWPSPLISSIIWLLWWQSSICSLLAINYNYLFTGHEIDRTMLDCTGYVQLRVTKHVYHVLMTKKCRSIWNNHAGRKKRNFINFSLKTQPNWFVISRISVRVYKYIISNPKQAN